MNDEDEWETEEALFPEPYPDDAEPDQAEPDQAEPDQAEPDPTEQTMSTSHQQQRDRESAWKRFLRGHRQQ